MRCSATARLACTTLARGIATGNARTMMAGWLLMLVALAYLGLLFTVAWLGERHPGFGQGPRWRPAVPTAP